MRFGSGPDSSLSVAPWVLGLVQAVVDCVLITPAPSLNAPPHPQVLAPLGADTSGSVFLDPDGTFPNHPPNPEHPAAMVRRAVRQRGRACAWRRSGAGWGQLGLGLMGQGRAGAGQDGSRRDLCMGGSLPGLACIGWPSPLQPRFSRPNQPNQTQRTWPLLPLPYNPPLHRPRVPPRSRPVRRSWALCLTRTWTGGGGCVGVGGG